MKTVEIHRRLFAMASDTCYFLQETKEIYEMKSPVEEVYAIRNPSSGQRQELSAEMADINRSDSDSLIICIDKTVGYDGEFTTEVKFGTE